MATFPDIKPSYNSQKTTSSQINVTQFNDGYQHRIKFGLNTRPYVWSLTFDVSEAESDTIEGFLEARSDDGASFDWQPPGSAVAYKWICLQWTKRIPFLNRASLSMTFQQVFEP
tara:strand:+ start:1786 stop:2127 length:342 start_codon:yes stop_codon:yes gene_type:complete